MIKINTQLYINGINYSAFLVQPIKWANFLDERLDEGYLTLTGVKDFFTPTDKVEAVFTITNNIKNNTETIHKWYVIANDNAEETPPGSGVYIHNIYVIELTKYLELHVTDTITFTNVLNRNSAQAKSVTPYYIQYLPDPNPGGGSYQYDFTKYASSTLYSNPVFNGQITIYPLASVLDSQFIGGYTNSLNGNGIRVYDNSNNIIYSYNYPSGLTDFPTYGGTTLSAKGAIRIEYLISWHYQSGDTTRDDVGIIAYNVAILAQSYPIKRITCADAINRISQLSTPLLKGENSIFILDDKDINEFSNIYLPEMSLTQCTLREALQDIGKIIHGEPRLIPYGINTYKIKYDKYGDNVVATLPNVYIEHSTEHSINEYCSDVDSVAENIVNQLDYAQGVVIEPRENASKTVRCEEIYARITDENMLIKTSLGVNKIYKCEVICDGLTEYVDITPYIFEKTIYNSQLSSYSNAYPYSKAYGIYYTIGDNTISGLNFKEEAAWFQEFKNYAIVNIIERASGVSISTTDAAFYPTIRFRITYTPYFDVRLTQSKPCITDFKTQATLIYNQSSNIIENRAYGENLKGVVARLGNIEKTRTYYLSSFSQIPKAGDKFDKDYYISTVAVEIYNNAIKCTIGLSKDFNRLSQYIGVSSERRLYEVSERAAYDRTSLYKEYIYIGNDEHPDNKSLLGDTFFSALQNMFTNNSTFNYHVDHVIAQGETYSGSLLSAVELPVVSTALGNAIVFIWGYKDNYSAGEISIYQSSGAISGYFQNDYQYTDYYGKMYYYNFDIQCAGNSTPGTLDEALAFPGTTSTLSNTGIFSTKKYQPYIYRKDSREATKICAEIEFVTNRHDIIIGSGIASNNPLVSVKTNNEPARLYLLPFKINKFIDRITDNLDNIPYIGTYIYPTYTGTYANVKQYTAVSGTSTVSAGTYYTTQDGVISNAETNASGQNVYTDYLFNCKTGAFKLVSPVPLDSISPGRTWYSTDIDGNTGAETGNQIYWFQLNSKNASSGDIVASRISITAIANTGSAIFIEKISENGLATDKLKMDIITDISGLPDYSSWAFISPQYTQTETVEDEEGNIYAQTYYDGGDVYIGANTPINGDALYFTAIHDPFKQYEVIATSGGTLATISGYKYARYDEGVGRFFVDTPIKQNELSVNDIVFNVSPYGDYPKGDTLTQSTVTAISENSITVSNEIIRRKIWTSS